MDAGDTDDGMTAVTDVTALLFIGRYGYALRRAAQPLQLPNRVSETIRGVRFKNGDAARKYLSLREIFHTDSRSIDARGGNSMNSNRYGNRPRSP